MKDYYSQADITYRPYHPDEADELVDWLVSDTWPHHAHSHLDDGTVYHWIEAGMFTGANNRTFWILLEGYQKIGLLRLFEMATEAPLFDLRLWTPYRNRLIGRAALAWLTDFVFTQYPRKTQVEAVTRTDNHPMRRILRCCGYERGGYHRETWCNDYGNYDSVVQYGITRDQWLAN